MMGKVSSASSNCLKTAFAGLQLNHVQLHFHSVSLVLPLPSCIWHKAKTKHESPCPFGEEMYQMPLVLPRVRAMGEELYGPHVVDLGWEHPTASVSRKWICGR